MRIRYDQLDPEARLLMYLAGELPQEECTLVEEALRRDPALQRQLESLQSAQGAFQGLAEIDAREPLPVSVASATRNAIRMIRQQRAQEIASPARRSRISRNWNWVLYPAGAAAAVLVIGMILWSQKRDDPRAPVAPEFAQIDDPESITEEDDVLFRLVPRFRPSREEYAVALDNSERELDALLTLTDSSAMEWETTK